MELTYQVKTNEQTINQILKNELQISSRLLYKLIKLQKILLNNKICDTRSITNAEDIITIDFNDEEDNSTMHTGSRREGNWWNPECGDREKTTTFPGLGDGLFRKAEADTAGRGRRVPELFAGAEGIKRILCFHRK